MNESACPIFKHEDSLKTGSHRSNMKTSIHQNILFVVVISLLIVSTESVMLPPTRGPRHKELRRALNDQSFTTRSADFLVTDVGRTSRKLSPRIENKSRKLDKDGVPDIHRSRKYGNLIAKGYENTVLSLLGIRKPGKTGRSRVDVPQFMLDLYKQQVTKNAWTSLGRRHRRGMEHFQGDVVRSFRVENKGLLMENNSLRTILKAVVDGHHYQEETIRGAELRVFYWPAKSPNITSNDRLWHKLELHHVKRRRHAGKHRTLIDVNYFEDQNPRWISFNVTEALTFLQRNSKLYLTFEMNDFIDGDYKDSNGGMFSALNNDASHQSILVIYSNNLNQQSTTSKNRPKRSSSEGYRNPKRGGPSQRQRSYKHFQKQCSRKPLYVDFAELDWLEWIVAPSGFHAFLCQGTCPREVEHHNATNHAVLQSLLHFKNSTVVPPTCCVPTQLSPIALLIVDFDTVVLKNYKDMIVDTCGCR